MPDDDRVVADEDVLREPEQGFRCQARVFLITHDEAR